MLGRDHVRGTSRVGRRRRYPLLSLLAAAVYLLCAQRAAAEGTYVQAAIPAQPLEAALLALAEQTQLQVLYASTLITHRRSAPVSGGASPLEALRQLLTGTGLGFEPLPGGGVQLVRVSPRRDATGLADPASLEDVVVVANHREQSLLAVPVSARVVSLADLEPFSLGRADELLTRLPGVDYEVSSQWGAGLYNHVTLRGIASERSGSTTVVYLGDTPLYDALTPHSMFTLPFPILLDLERVEVLRGPQGVEYGAGAEGGALRFVPRRATVTDDSMTAHLDAGVTQEGGSRLSVEGAVGLPLIPGRLGLRLSGLSREDGGYVDRVNPFDGRTVEHDSNRSAVRGARVSIDYEPTDSLSVRPSIDYQQTRLHDSPVFYPSLSDAARGVFRNGKLMAQPFDEALKVAALRVDQRWPSVTLTSVTSYTARESSAVIDQTNEAGALYFGGYGDPAGPEIPTSYADAVTDRARADVETFAQELRIMSTPSARRLEWTAGFFYARFARSESERSYLTPVPSLPALAQGDIEHTSEFNAFAQARWAVSNRVKLGAGIRVGSYTTVARRSEGGYLVPENGAESRVRNAGALPITPRVDIAYQATERWMWYALASRGARIGRKTLPHPCGGQYFGGGYGTDSLWNYEVGVKGASASEVVTLDASVYDIEWHDVQTNTFDPCGQGYLTSAGDVTSRGVDLAMQVRPSPRWRLGLDLSVGDLRSRDTVYGLGGFLIALRGAALSGVPDVPAPWSGSLRAEYNRPLGEGIRGFVDLLWTVRSHHPGPFPEKKPAFPTYDPRFASDPATQRLSISVGMQRKVWEVRLYADNVFNSHPTLQLSGDAPGTPLLYAYTLRPRTVGLSVTVRREAR